MPSRPRILIIEDNADLQQLLRRYVTHHFPEAELSAESDGERGLTRARAEKPDVLLLDMQLPTRDGWSICRELKSDPTTRSVCILMMSAVNKSAADRAQGLELGADAFLTKPFEEDELVAQIRVLLRVKETEAQLRLYQQNLEDQLQQRAAALADSEASFRLLFEQSPDAMFVEDESGVVIEVNEAAVRLHEMPREALIGKNVLDLVPPAHREVVRRDYPKWFAGGLTKIEGYSYSSSGRIIPVEVKASRLVYGGKPALLLTVRDTTDRTNLDDRQHTTMQGLRAVVEIADELIACSDVDAVYRRAVELSRQQLGLERAAIFLSDGHRVRATFGTDMRGHVTDERSHVIPMDDLWRERFRLRSQSEPRWSLSFEPFQDWEDGHMKPRGQGWVAVTPIQTARQAVGVFCNDSAITKAPFDPVRQEIVAVFSSLLANIIERKHAEAERARLATALEQSAEAVVITDVQGTINFVNPAFERITGYTASEAIGQNPRMLKSGRVTNEVYASMWNTLGRGEVWTGHITNRRKDGRLYEAEQVISPIKSASGEITGYLAVSQDVTRAMELEQALRQSQKMESIGRLAGGIAHDFNNLLTGILGFARLVNDILGPGHECRPDMEEIIKSGERAARLTRQLLAFGHKQVIQMRPLDINGIVGRIDELLRHSLGADIELVTEEAASLPSIEADPGMIEQILMNLAVNARDAMPRGGKLYIRTSFEHVDAARIAGKPGLSPGPYVCLTVRDTGAGMKDYVKQHAFEPFFTTKDKEQGRGLGLSTVYGIVKHCRGFIELQSEAGKGTTFHIFFPSVDARPASDAIATPAPVGDGNETILVVEDEGSVRKLVVRALMERGYRVLEASHGGEALNVYQQCNGAIDLLLTDVVMPIMGGPELVAHLRELRPDLRVLYMSGYAENQHLQGVGSSTSGALILKPFTIETLSTEVRRMLDYVG